MTGRLGDRRQALPDRRPHFVVTIEWRGSWIVGVGLDRDGIAREIWADPLVHGDADEDLVTLVHEGAIVASWLLQHGLSAQEVAARLGAQRPALLAQALLQAAEIEAAHGDQVRELERWLAARLAGRPIPVPTGAGSGSGAEGEPS